MLFIIKKIFLQNEYIFKKDLYFICKTNIFCIKLYFSNEIYIFYIFIYIFLCKKVFFSKKFFQYKTFFLYKNLFCANNVYFVKNPNIVSKKNFFFNLVLQQIYHRLGAFKTLGTRLLSSQRSFNKYIF